MENNLYQLFMDALDQSLAGNYLNPHRTLCDQAKKYIINGNQLYIWPAGIMGKTFFDRIKQSGYCNIKLVDSNAKAENSMHIIKPEDIENCQQSVLVIASLSHSNKIYHLAKNMGFKNILMYYDVVDILLNELQDFPEDFYIKIFDDCRRLLLENKKLYIDMYNSLEDELSKTRFLENMMFRLTKDITYTFRYDDKLPQYFNALVPKPSKESVIVDGGGYIGDTLEQFLVYSNRNFKSYYLFEPDFKLLEQAKRISNDNRIHYIGKGLSNELSEKRFLTTEGGGGVMGGHISECGNTMISLTSIDSEISDKITFIKLDIEGAELDALKGAEKTIKSFKPTLAVCLYHKASDYIDIFEYIRNINPEYKFFIRHHSDYYTETVLYAI